MHVICSTTNNFKLFSVGCSYYAKVVRVAYHFTKMHVGMYNDIIHCSLKLKTQYLYNVRTKDPRSPTFILLMQAVHL